MQEPLLAFPGTDHFVILDGTRIRRLIRLSRLALIELEIRGSNGRVTGVYPLARQRWHTVRYEIFYRIR